VWSELRTAEDRCKGLIAPPDDVRCRRGGDAPRVWAVSGGGQALASRSSAVRNRSTPTLSDETYALPRRRP